MRYELERAWGLFNGKWAAIGFGIAVVADIYIYLTHIKTSPYPTSTEEVWLFIVIPVAIAVVFGFIFSKDMMN